MIRGVFFDAGGILYARTSSSRDFLRGLLERRGHRATLDAARDAERRALQREASLGHVPVREYWRRVFALYAVPAAAHAELVEQMMRFADEIVPTPDAARAVAELKRRGKLVGVITDTMYPLEQKMSWLDRAGVASMLDVVACSSALGLKKPEPAIYEHALRQARLGAEESAFVGHDQDELDGARAVGMRTIALSGGRPLMAERSVRSLSELATLDLLAA